MIIKNFKKGFYQNAEEAIIDNFENVEIIYADGENKWDNNRYKINNEVFKLVNFEHFNGQPLEINLKND